jgi:hypothetical protein
MNLIKSRIYSIDIVLVCDQNCQLQQVEDQLCLMMKENIDVDHLLFTSFISSHIMYLSPDSEWVVR